MPNRVVGVKKEAIKLTINGAKNCQQNGGIQELLMYQDMIQEVITWGNTARENKTLAIMGTGVPSLTLSEYQLHSSL